MLNVVVLMGRLTADPELKHTQSGNSVTSFSIAVDRSYCKQGEERQADFINIVAWRSAAEFICKYFGKGKLIALQGEIQTRKYTDKSGNNRTAVEVVADQASFAEPKSKESSKNTYEPASSSPDVSAGKDDFEEAPSDDDLPF